MLELAARLAFHGPAAAQRRALAAPERAQAAVLARVIEGLSGTAYAAVHGSPSVERFADGYPLVHYADLRPFIERQMHGEPRVLGRDRVRCFEKTSGSGGPRKYIPYTRGLRRSFSRMFAIWADDVLRRLPGLGRGRFYFSISPRFDRETKTAGGIPVGLDSDADYLSLGVRALLRPKFAVDPDVSRIRDPLDFRDQVASRLLQTDDLAIISVWSPSFLRVLLEHMRTHAERLLAHARRADRILRALRDADYPAIWPQLALISLWDQGSAAAGARAIREDFPGVLVQGKGLLATEAPMTVPSLAHGGCLPLLDEVYYELLDEAGGLHPIHALPRGRALEVVVSIPGGFTRYRTGDLVEVTGHVGRVPMLAFVGRRDGISDMAGEKLTEPFVAEVLARLEPAVRAPMVLVPAPATAQQGARYVLILATPPTRERAELAASLDVELGQAHHYRLCRDLGQLDPPEVLVCPSLGERRMALLTRGGASIGDIKDTFLAPAELLLEVMG
jgi:hypothetical protein